jgi:murein DD-endopeptidase MepM/ murein hydrolase activator NlpD
MAAAAEVVAAEVVAAEVVAAVAEGRRPRGRHRRPPSIRRRPALYLAAALVGAISTGGVVSKDTAAQADTVSSSMSVAQELGITSHSTPVVADAHVTERLVELAASRNERDAEQAAAVQVQADADAAAAEAARPKAVLPVAGARLTSTFGPRWGTLHAGIDLAAPIGTAEYAAMDGIVLEAGPASGFGLAVYIQHQNGDVTVYGHMEKILVSAGQVVKAGDTIALLGNRGQSTGPHLHFEVHVGGINGTKIDPLPWLRERGIAI